MKLKELERLSPVPVYFLDTLSNSNFAGMYHKSKNCSGKPYIEVANNMNNNQKIITLIHEIGHAICDVKGCKCLKNPDHTEREIHANRFTLNQLMKYKLKKELKSEMKRIEQQANGFTCYSYYIEAGKHIIKLKLWQKCLNYINNP